MSYLQTLIEKKKGIAASIDTIRKDWKGKEGTMPPEVEEKLDRALEDYDATQAKIEREEKAAKVDAFIATPNDTDHLAVTNGAVTSGDLVAARHSAFVKSLLRGSPMQAQFTDAERKAMQADDWAGGGVLLAPQQFVSQVLKNMDDQLFMRQLSTVYPNVGAAGLGVPTMESDASEADWTGEITESSETSVSLGKRELKPIEMKKAVKIAYKLLRNSRIDFGGFVQERIAYKFALPQERAFLVGTGANQPLGVFTASADGIETGRDVAAASSTVLVGDDFIDALYGLKGQYQNKASWLLHRTVVKAARKLKTSQGEYIWTPEGMVGKSLVGNAPGMLLGRPFYMSEYVPNTQTTGLYVGIVGDFSHYWIVDGEDMRVQVLNELYARTSQVGYHVEASCDGAPVLEEAFSRLKMA